MTPEALSKTFRRTRRFLVDGLLWRGEARCYAPVAWALLAGLVWVGLDLAIDRAALWTLLPYMFLLAILAAVAAIDARFGIIPDSFTLALLIGGLLQLCVIGWRDAGLMAAVSRELSPLGLELGMMAWRVLDALVAFAGAALLRVCYRALRGREGFGFGDVKFIGAAALWVGGTMLPLVLVVAVTSALGTILLLRKESARLGRADAIPFGPHLAVGLWLTALLSGEVGTEVEVW